jgi:hypothetical protein
MATILSTSELLSYQPMIISATAGTIVSRKLIETVEQRIPIMINNYFISETMQVQATAVFNQTAGTIIIDQNNWSEFGFKNGDDIFIYNSLRNEGYLSVDTFVTDIATIASAYTVYDEAYNNNLGQAILFAVVQWPLDIKYIASEMIYYDIEIRPKRSLGIRSRSLGPLSESYGGETGTFGYPVELIDRLEKYSIARFN